MLCIFALHILVLCNGYENLFGNQRSVRYLQPKSVGEYQWFGASVAVYDGYAIVGAPGNYEYNTRGTANIFELQSDGNNWKGVAELKAPNNVIGDGYAQSVEIQGSHAVVGASS